MLKFHILTDTIDVNHNSKMKYQGHTSKNNYIEKLAKLLWTMLFFGVLVLSSIRLHAQSQITFRQLSVKDGLSQNSAVAITQDSTGYLWIATQDGLNRYDGRKFTKYPFQFVDITRPNYSHLGKLYVDKQQQLWIIPKDNVPYKYNSERDVFMPMFGIEDAYTLFQDSNRNYWISTYAKEVFFVDGTSKQITKIHFEKPLQGVVNEIAEIHADTVLLLGKNEFIKITPDTKKVHFVKPENLSNKNLQGNFSTITVGTSGEYYLGTYGNGLFVTVDETNKLGRIPANSLEGSLPTNLNILDLLLDSKNRLWIATYGQGLFMVDLNTHKRRHFTNEKHNPRTLHYNDILCIYEDYLGTLWFGTDGAGISYYDEYLEKFNSLTNNQTPEDINIDVVRSIAVTSDSIIWTGTSGKGLTRYDQKKDAWKTFSQENSDLPSDRIMSLHINDTNDDLWIGTQGNGLSILNTEGTFDNFSEHTKVPLSAKTIWNIFKDNAGRFWLATNENGLIQFDKQLGEVKNFKLLFPEEKSALGSTIRVITQDLEGNLWLGTDNAGVVKFNPIDETFVTSNIPKMKSLSENSIKSLYYEPRGVLWIGTNGLGLNALDFENDTLYRFKEEDGLSNNVIYGILPDSKSNLWLSSNKGITKFTPKSSWEETPDIVNYNNYDGLATEFNTGAYFKSANENLYFGGLDGFYWFQPENIKDNIILPKTTITDFEVLDEKYPMLQETQLESEQNTLAFTFSSLQFSLPAKNEFQYRLLNHDNNWVSSGNNNYVRYTLLPPGNYEFQVKSSNYDGVWNEIPETFSFSILSPWYLTSFAKFVYFLLTCLTGLGIYWYLKWRWHMQLSLQLKEEETERLQKLNDFKSNLYTDIAHEFKTPLTLISGPIDQKLSQGNLSDFDHANFSIVKRNTTRLTSLVDQLLELAKLEDGKISLNVLQGDLSLFLVTISQSFEYQAYLKDIDYSVEINSIGEVWYDEDIIEKITTNLLSNAFKYSPKNGTCVFWAERKGDCTNIHVKNTAINASKLQLDKLFTRFYQYDSYSEGMGVGLSLVKELVNVYGGTIEVTLEKSDLLHFNVELPISRSSFAEEAIKEIRETSQRGAIKSDVLDIDYEISDETQEELPILLIVEDHQEVRTFIKLALQSKYRILEAENGKTGMEIALSQIPDIVLSDIRMPLQNGIALCNALKTDQRTSHIPIILLTASVGEEDELKGLTSGADDFVTKPFKINVLEQRIANLVAVRRMLRYRYSQELILKPKDIAVTPSDEIFLNKIQQILDENLMDSEFNSTAFSKKAKMSRMQLHRKLQAYTGLSTSAFIRSQRLKQALEILKTSDLSISEVAYTVGFNTPTYFMTCFREVYKKTPSEYIESLRNQ